ncbi:MAG: MFS transporter [Bacteroidota bacterium]
MDSLPARRPRVTLAAMALCMCMQMIGFMMISPLFALRLESFGAGVQALGMSASAFALAAMAAAPFMGVLADRLGRRPIILLSLAAYALAFSGYLFAASAWVFIVLRGLAGALTAGLVPAMTSTVGDLASENRRAQWIGIVMGAASVGWVVGPPLGGLLYDHLGYFAAFAASIGMELGALLLAASMIRETHNAPVAPAKARPGWAGSFRGLPALPVLALPLFLSFGVMFAWAFIEPPLMFYAYDDLGWSSSRLGAVLGAYGFACMFGEFVLARLSDHLGRKPVLTLGLALFSAQFIGLLLFRDALWIAVSFVVAGLGNALFDPALSAHLLDVTPPDGTARIMGLKAAAGSIGNMLGPALVVLVTPISSPNIVFMAAGILAIALALATALALRVPRRTAAAPDFSDAAFTQ